jgi:acetyl-CoA carboxylase biotin carboxylase subunit
VLFRKVLIANRGEIAVRVIRACRELGIPTVGVYSDADRASLHVRMADEAAHIGPAPSSQSYLCIDRVLAAAREHGADAIHPGYGFLSENADFAQACTDAGLTFIGPSANSIRQMGSKVCARDLVKKAGVPVLPGTSKGLSNAAEARRFAASIGYPVLIKADAGGGGKGMRRVDSEAELDSALLQASSEAERAFRSGSVYVEKLLERAHHIEIQVLGDKHGNLIHLGERECSIQRRHQKVIEESPSPMLARFPDLRPLMGSAAVEAAKAVGYENAGTVEFLVGEMGDFYFLEMNTRLQVEHPVTELVTGLDLVHWQLRIAAGEPLTISQRNMQWRGSAIECRLYAEDPEQNFFPSPGRITRWEMPAGPGIRLDAGAYQGWTVPLDYDPLLAKLVVWAETRDAAVERMRRAISECSVGGVKTNIPFFAQILVDSEFCAGNLHTGFIDDWFGRRGAVGSLSQEEQLAAALVAVVSAQAQKTKTAVASSRSSGWLVEGRAEMLR